MIVKTSSNQKVCHEIIIECSESSEVNHGTVTKESDYYAEVPTHRGVVNIESKMKGLRERTPHQVKRTNQPQSEPCRPGGRASEMIKIS